jgi:nucleoside-diphosphate-sugar epimerase
MKNLFITGGSGFIGSHLIKQINSEGYKNIYCLGRREVDRSLYGPLPENIRFIKGDILKPESYEKHLSVDTIVIHLAALTGKAPREEYFRINTEGTRVLTELCRNKEIERIVFISSIAAAFKNIEGYHYAESKIEAERIVKHSGVPFTILRPTIVTGKGSPIFLGLSKLAKMPVVPLFNGGKALIQPVYIADLTACILKILEQDAFLNQTVTAAGQEQITMEDFIRKIHDLTSRKKFRSIGLPVRPIAKILLKLENRLLPYLPFTAGQLASFTNDGISEGSNCYGNDNAQLKNVDEMLNLSFLSDDTVCSDADLEKEFKTFSNYLIGYEPDGYIKSRYVRGHRITEMDRNGGSFDLLLVRMANRSKLLARLADTYTSGFYKNALLRKKLFLLLAILESCGSTYRHIDTVNERSVIALYVKVVQKAAVFFLTLILSGIIFVPLKFLTSLLSRGDGSRLSHG